MIHGNGCDLNEFCMTVTEEEVDIAAVNGGIFGIVGMIGFEMIYIEKVCMTVCRPGERGG